MLQACHSPNTAVWLSKYCIYRQPIYFGIRTHDPVWPVLLLQLSLTLFYWSRRETQSIRSLQGFPVCSYFMCCWRYCKHQICLVHACLPVHTYYMCFCVYSRYYCCSNVLVFILCTSTQRSATPPVVAYYWKGTPWEPSHGTDHYSQMRAAYVR